MRKSAVLLLIGLGPVIASSSLALAEAADAYSGPVKISMAQAIEIALKKQPGVITTKELEREPGGSGVRYSFDIKVGNATHEVGVDANTGKVLENSIESTNPD